MLADSATRNKIKPIVTITEGVFRTLIRKKADALFACSEEAGVITFGKTINETGKFKVIRNAIDLDVFHYDVGVYKKICEETGIDSNTFVIGNVGKLAKKKNQAFLIKVFRIIHMQIKNSQLWLIGAGTDESKLRLLTKELGIEDVVKFLGEKKDVYRFLHGMSAFVFPTLSEGFGIAAVEAQAIGLPTVVSNGVPRDILITPLAKMLSLSDNEEKWAKEILELYKEYPDHPDYSEAIRSAGYDINYETEIVTDYYLQL